MTSPAEHRSGPASPRGGGRRLILGLVVFASVSFVGGILLAVIDPAEVAVPSYEADTFSRSAIGHRGLVRWLRALDVPVVISRAGTAAKAGPGTVLAILEPPLEDDDGRLTRLLDAAEPDAVLIALPKWTGDEHASTDGWIARLSAVQHTERDKILQRLGIDARSVDADAGPWSWRGGPPPVEPAIPDVRAVEGALEPLLTRGDRVVVGTTEREGTPIVLVADPDLLSNAGLVHHAPLLAALLEPSLGERVLVVDETLHGYLTTASIARQLFEFPLAALTAQVVAMIALALLAGVRRFGAPLPVDRARGGRRVLIENTAALGQYAGHDADALERYWQVTLDGVARALHAPSGLDRAATMAWLDRIGRSRGVDEAPDALARSADEATPGERLATARRIHRWRRSMTASATDTQGHAPRRSRR